MGKSSGGGDTRASRLQADIAERLFTQTDPLRTALINMNQQFLGIPSSGVGATQAPFVSSGGGAFEPAKRRLGQGPLAALGEQVFLEGASPEQVAEFTGQAVGANGEAAPQMSFANLDPSVLPQFQVGKDIIEQQFGRARENIIGSTPMGGALTSALAGAERDRARSLGTLGATATQDQINQALQLATGSVGQVQSGLSAVQQAQAQAQAAESAKKGSAGQAAGTVAAAALTKNPAAVKASDRRLKTDIEKIGVLPNGINWYRFRYIGDDDIQEGVMADEVDHIADAVYQVDGFSIVDYSKVLTHTVH